MDLDDTPITPAHFTVDVNEAGWPDLVILPRIGPTLAMRIIASREQRGALRVSRRAHAGSRYWAGDLGTRQSAPAILEGLGQRRPGCRQLSKKRDFILSEFRLEKPFEPAGDQPQAIEAIISGLEEKRREQVLMGVTGSGKTFTMANIIQSVQRPTLVLSHNKTLAAQLYAEFRDFFPHNAVHYFGELLRLLSTRGVHSTTGHLHREGCVDQLRDRPAEIGFDELTGQPV